MTLLAATVVDFIVDIVVILALLATDHIREACELNNVPKRGKKSTIFFLPQNVLDFFEFGQNFKSDDPPPP